MDKALKDIIETLEPGVHQFWPIRIQTYKGIDHPTPYFGLVVGSFLDAFSPEHSDAAVTEENGSRYYISAPTKKYVDKLVLKADAIGDAHLWRDGRLDTPELFLSDRLKAAVDEAGLRIPKHFKMKVA